MGRASGSSFLQAKTTYTAAMYLCLWWAYGDDTYLRALSHVHYERLLNRIPSIWL